ncbi:MAG: fructose-6-phosphate aldolase [Phycisphaerales bacterium]|nr:fructose-6-phosphate aldolase [Phycisphaerales bacterium]
MDLYIDTASISEIKEAHALGVLDGVTTNPSLIAKEMSGPGAVPGLTYAKRLAEICEIVKGPVSAEVISLEYAGMMKEAEAHLKIAPNIVVKLPTTVDGLKACKALSDQGLKTNMTLVFQPLQAMLVAKAGAFLVSPFIGRLDDIAEDGMDLIHKIRTIYDNYGFTTKILAASVRHQKHMVDCALAGSDVATVPLSVIKGMLNHPLTDSGLKKFTEDYKKAFPNG